MSDPIRDSIWRSNVNTFLGGLFVGCFALGGALIIWYTAFGYNPLEEALAAHFFPVIQELDK